MLRLILSDAQWDRLLGAIGSTPAHKTKNLRLIVEGILWRFRTGAPWRDLPDDFGPWKTVFNRFNNWAKSGVWQRLFESIRGEMDNEWNFMDGTYIKVHQHASGGVEPSDKKTIAPSRGGKTTKVHMLTDAHGNPATFVVSGGNVNDVSVAAELVDQSSAENIIGDKGYDCDALRAHVIDRGAIPHIPMKTNSKRANPQFDKELYRYRHLVENLFARMKHFRAFATRYDKLTRNFSSTVYIACMLIWLCL